MTLTLKDDIQRHVVTKGNYGFAAAGQTLFTVQGSGNHTRINYNVNPGQLVAYTISNGVTTTVDEATLASTDIYELFVGVGIDLNGDGKTDDIRYIGIENISGCVPREVSTSSPKCGAPQVVDFYFDCTQCDETYSVMVKVDDNKTRSYSPWNKSFSEFVGSIVTNCSSCDDCPVEHNCREVACKLADALNWELDLRVGTKQYPDWRGRGLPRPYWATRLHANSYIYCLAPTEPDGECVDCTHIAAVTGATINGTTYSFTGVTDSANSTLAFKGQLHSVVTQLNEAFETEYGSNSHAGSAYNTGSYAECCPIQLHVNTCDGTFELLDANSAAITPTVTNNPFTVYGTVTGGTDCIDCDESPTTTAYPCGIRVIAERITGECECYITKPLSFYSRKLEIHPFGDGWKGKPWRVVEVEAMELPAGFGEFIRFLELQDIPEGRGRYKSSRSSVNKGWGNLPGNKARIKNQPTADCTKDYCSYYLKSFIEKKKLSNEYGVITIHSHVHIPSDDSTTISAWETFFSALIGFNPTCKVLNTTSCTPDLICSAVTPAPTTPAPTTPAPITPAPLTTPAPVSPAPQTPAPLTTPAPGTPAPATAAPATPAPATPAPTTPAPATPAPTTPAPA